MAKPKGTTSISLIATLAQSRAAIFHQADQESGRSLTEEELERINALNSVIANCQAKTPREAAAQVRVAFEIIDLLWDGADMPASLDVAHAALRSAAGALDRPRKRAA